MSAVITIANSGTQTAVINTEHTLEDAVANGIFILSIDLANMQNGDTMELKVYTKVLSGGALNCCMYEQFIDAQNTTVQYQSVPFPSDIEVKFTLKQTAGTGRAYPWKVIAL
jgi:hypothetical protein